ncbi:hypothetical protein QVD17_38335 [Tagetes erecta]|uniref:Uncharacterized protein n=1 Tax=Tagetes erecta TaxID=13708 RepID=A0AAD8NFB6_TARER|nr:hypothetical protein QVD17_38335 [Tagetes erecta]
MKWLMKNNKWEVYTDDDCESKYDVVHSLTTSLKDVYICDDGTQVPNNGDYIRASIFVKSLVSPHPHEERKRSVKEQGNEGKERVESGGNLRKRKRKRGL